MYRLALLVALSAVAAGFAEDRKLADDIDRLSRRLERDTRELHEEVLQHFRRARCFKDLERHAKEIERLAGTIHKLSERDGRHKFVRDVLGKIDEEVRQFDRHVLELAREKEIDRRAFDHLRDEVGDINRILYRLRRELP